MVGFGGRTIVYAWHIAIPRESIHMSIEHFAVTETIRPGRAALWMKEGSPIDLEDDEVR